VIERSLHIAAYDISDPRRLRQALRVLKAYATGGQKSVFECFLTEGERRSLFFSMKVLIEPADRFLIVRLDPRRAVIPLGRAIAPCDPPFFYVE
jgi:CRISPR-associated protein Cas2